MTDKEKIRAEIERRKKLHEETLNNPIHQGFGLQKVIKAKISELTYFLSFIDSLEEEPVSEDLNTAAKEYADNITDKVGYKLQLRRAVCFGAKWQEEQIRKDAIKATAHPEDQELWCDLSQTNLQDGQEVKVIVIKED